MPKKLKHVHMREELITSSTLDKLNTKVEALSGDVVTMKDAHTEESVEPDHSTDGTVKTTVTKGAAAGETDEAADSGAAASGSLHASSSGNPAAMIESASAPQSRAL
jgi:hypothetical protein